MSRSSRVAAFATAVLTGVLGVDFATAHDRGGFHNTPRFGHGPDHHRPCCGPWGGGRPLDLGINPHVLLMPRGSFYIPPPPPVYYYEPPVIRYAPLPPPPHEGCYVGRQGDYIFWECPTP